MKSSLIGTEKFKYLNVSLLHTSITEYVYTSPMYYFKYIQYTYVFFQLSCVNPVHLKICIARDDIIKLIYAENLEILIFDVALNDEALVLTFSSLIFEFILNNLVNETERECIIDLVNRLKFNFKLTTSDDMANEYIYKILKT